jgi:hypothetical protein
MFINTTIIKFTKYMCHTFNDKKFHGFSTVYIVTNMITC